MMSHTERKYKKAKSVHTDFVEIINGEEGRLLN